MASAGVDALALTWLFRFGIEVFGILSVFRQAYYYLPSLCILFLCVWVSSACSLLVLWCFAILSVFRRASTVFKKIIIMAAVHIKFLSASSVPSLPPTHTTPHFNRSVGVILPVNWFISVPEVIKKLREGSIQPTEEEKTTLQINADWSRMMVRLHSPGGPFAFRSPSFRIMNDARA